MNLTDEQKAKFEAFVKADYQLTVSLCIASGTNVPIPFEQKEQFIKSQPFRRAPKRKLLDDLKRVALLAKRFKESC